MRKPELNPTSLKIDELINGIDNGEIKIPAFHGLDHKRCLSDHNITLLRVGH